MTEPHLDDEALSALLDGDTGAVERSHIDDCAECQSRLEGLRFVSQAVAAPVAPRPPVEISAAINVALAAAARAKAQGEVKVDGPVSLRRHAGRAQPRAVRLLAVAAAVVAVAGIGSLIAVTASHHRGSRATSTASGSAPTPAAAAGAAASGPVTTVASATGAAPPVALAAPGLGDQGDPAALAAALRALEVRPSAAPAAASPPVACLGPAAASAGQASTASPRLVTPLRWQGQDAQAVVFARPTPPGGQIAIIVGVPGCAVLTSIPL